MSFIKIEAFLQNKKTNKKIELNLPIDFKEYDLRLIYLNTDSIETIEPLITEKDEYFTIIILNSGSEVICPMNFNAFEKKHSISKETTFFKYILNYF